MVDRLGEKDRERYLEVLSPALDAHRIVAVDSLGEREQLFAAGAPAVLQRSNAREAAFFKRVRLLALAGHGGKVAALGGE